MFKNHRSQHLGLLKTIHTNNYNQYHECCLVDDKIISNEMKGKTEKNTKTETEIETETKGNKNVNKHGFPGQVTGNPFYWLVQSFPVRNGYRTSYHHTFYIQKRFDDRSIRFFVFFFLLNIQLMPFFWGYNFIWWFWCLFSCGNGNMSNRKNHKSIEINIFDFHGWTVNCVRPFA